MPKNNYIHSIVYLNVLGHAHTLAKMDSFQWPWQYNFPPFFTIQPNSDTKHKQVDAWCELVLNYHKEMKSYVFDINEAYGTPLFNNEKINSESISVCNNIYIILYYFVLIGKLSIDGINTVLEALHARGIVGCQSYPAHL